MTTNFNTITFIDRSESHNSQYFDFEKGSSNTNTIYDVDLKKPNLLH